MGGSGLSAPYRLQVDVVALAFLVHEVGSDGPELNLAAWVDGESDGESPATKDKGKKGRVIRKGKALEGGGNGKACTGDGDDAVRDCRSCRR